MWQGTGCTDELDQPLIAKVHQRVDQTFTLERFGVAAVELQDINVIGPETLKAGLDISL